MGKPRRRVDADPVRVHRDGRVVYWTGGVPGEGRRVFTRPRLGQSPEELAAELRATLGTPEFDRGRRTVLQLCENYFEAHAETVTGPVGDGAGPARTYDSTRRKYRSSINTHVLGVIGAVRCRDLCRADLLEVVDTAIDHGSKPNTVKGIVTSLSAVVTWGIQRGWFSSHPFGDRRETNKILAATLRAHYDGEHGPIGVDVVPTHDAVRRCAAALEEKYTGGRHVVMVMAASGLRIAEMVAVRVEDVDLDTMRILVSRQGRRDRRRSSDAHPQAGTSVWTGSTKGRRMRYTHVWACAREHLEWLVEHAEDGWLVPPDAGQRRWLDAINRRLSAACAEAGWPEHQRGHWLRHHYATYSLTAAPVGYGFDSGEVSVWLGHSSAKVTDDLYRHGISGADQRALAITARALG